MFRAGPALAFPHTTSIVQNRAMRVYDARRGWALAMQRREVVSAARSP
jgi:hypothetical protein